MKRLTSLFLLLSLIVSIPLVSYAEYGTLSVDDLYEFGQEEADGEIFYEIGKNNISSEVKLLMDLGIVEHYYPNASLKRTALKNCVTIVGGSDVLYNKYFTDNNSETKTLNFNEALIVMMDLTGYASFAKENGGSESDYYNTALRYGLLDDVNLSDAKNKLTAEQYLKMVHNALTVKLVSYDYSNYKISKDDTLLNSFLKLEKVEGIVNANSYSALNGLGNAGKDRIRIGNKNYSVEKIKDSDEYLGFYVIAYVNDDNKIVSLSVDNDMNKMMDFDNSSELEESSSKQTFIYYNDAGKKKTLNVDKYADLMYNYSPVTAYTSDFYTIENGTIKLIDNDGDGKYDVVIKKEYNSFKPLSKSDFYYTVTDRLGNVYDIGELLRDESYHGIRDINGNPCTYDDIKVSGNVSVLTKKNSNVVTEIIVFDDIKYEGEYEAYYSSDDEYQIGDRKFKMGHIYSLLNKGKFPYNLGANVLVYLDPMGKIIDAETTTAEYKYAWLVDITEEAKKVEFKIFTQDDKMMTYEADKKIKINEKKIESSEIMSKNELYGNGKVREQLIKYKLNSDEKLIDILTADESNVGIGAHKDIGDKSFQKNLNHYDYYIENGNTGGGLYSLYNTGGKIFASKYLFSPTDTYLFYIPSQYYRDKYDDELFSVERSMPSGYGRFSLNLYDVSYDMVVGAAVKVSGDLKNEYMHDAAGATMVQKVTTIYDDYSDEEITKVFTENLSSSYSVNWMQYPLDDMGTNVLNASYDSDANLFKKYTKANYNLDLTAWENVKTMADLKPGMIVKPGPFRRDYITSFRTYFVYDKTKEFDDQMFEYATDVDSDMYDETTYELLPRGTYDTGGNHHGVTEDRFCGEYLCAFGKVVQKTKNGMVFNAKKGAPKEWNRIIEVTADKTVTFVNTKRDIIFKGTFAEVQEGDYLFLDMTESTLRGIAVYRK